MTEVPPPATPDPHDLTPGGTPATPTDPNDPLPSGAYPGNPPPSPTAPNYGYPFPVAGPTTPEQAADYLPPGTSIQQGQTAEQTLAGIYPPSTNSPEQAPPVEYQPPRNQFYDPTYNAPPRRRRPHHPQMPQDPFNTNAHDQETEFGWGEGMYPDPILDYSATGSKSRFPVADPDARDQLRNLAAIRRTDVASAWATANPYVAGNPDRFGAAPPLVRRRGKFKPGKRDVPKPPRMQREW